jgi:hypothetical protein
MLAFVALNLAAQGGNGCVNGMHQLVGLFFGTEQNPMLASQRQLHTPVSAMLLDIKGHMLDRAQVAFETSQFGINAGTGGGAEMTMLGANDKFHNALPCCTSV